MKPLLWITVGLFMSLGQNESSHTGFYKKAEFPFELPENTVAGKDVSFGYVTVPEFHGKSNGNTMEIAVAVFHSYSAEPDPEPLVLLSGGPGDSNIKTFTDLLCGDGGKLLRSNREVVLVEVRGTCFSSPNLLCPEISACEKEIQFRDLSGDEKMAYMLRSVEKAHDRFQEAGINLAAFNNREIADDINLVMKELEYEKYSVFGFSAGTITVQHLLDRHPESIHAATMTGVVSLEDNLAASSSNIIATLEHIFDLCEKDDSYRTAYPDLENRFLRMLDSLNETPVPIDIIDEKDRAFTYYVTGDKISRWLSFGMYTNNQVPLTISRFLEGDYSELTTSIYNASPRETFSHGLSFSIMASEFISSSSDSYAFNEKYKTFYRGLSSAWHSPKFNQLMAQVWDVEPVELDHQQLINDVPVLLLSAEFDHVCPPKYAEDLTSGLTNSRLYIFKGLTHTQVALTPCLLTMMHEFFSDPSKSPDDSCVEQYQTSFLLP